MLDMYSIRKFHGGGRVWIVGLIASCFLAFGLAAQDAAPVEEDIRGPKPLIEIAEPEPLPLALWAGIGGGLLLAGAAYAFWKMRRGKQHRKSPAEVALATLAELERNHSTLAAEAFANRAAQIVRQYISERFSMAATRRTTEEFFIGLTESAENPLIGESEHLRGFLKSCDLAKFAGATLDAAQREKLLDAARGLIAATRANPHAEKS